MNKIYPDPTTPAEMDKIYALRIFQWEDTWKVETLNLQKTYSSSYRHPTEQSVFSSLLQHFVEENDGTYHLPPDSDSPWEFVKGDSEEDIQNGKYEVIVQLSADSPENLWTLYQWVNHRCLGFQIYVDY